MITTIKNQHICISVNSLGAEISSLQTVNDDEYLWQGDPAIWKGQAPNLFPFIGKINNGRYQFEGKKYSISKHGFAKTSEFKLINQSDINLTYRLSDSPETLECYPFKFDLDISFTLDEFDFTLSGIFSQGSESVTASITMNIDPDTSVHTQTENLVTSWTGFYQAGQLIDSATSFEDESDIIGETEDNFIGVDFGIALEFDLVGSSDTTGIMLTATRTGLESASLSLDITVGSARLEIDAIIVSDDVEVTVTDQNGNTLILTETCNVETDICTVAGRIMIDGEQAAIIEQDADNDIFVITYQDGSFEVL